MLLFDQVLKYTLLKNVHGTHSNKINYSFRISVSQDNPQTSQLSVFIGTTENWCFMDTTDSFWKDMLLIKFQDIFFSVL